MAPQSQEPRSLGSVLEYAPGSMVWVAVAAVVICAHLVMALGVYRHARQRHCEVFPPAGWLGVVLLGGVLGLIAYVVANPSPAKPRP